MSKTNLIIMGLIAICIIVVSSFALVTLNTIRNKINEPINLSLENGISLTMEATGYAIGHPYSTITKSGQPVISKGFLKIDGLGEIFTVATDPKIIPLGSVVYVKGIGIGLAQDTGPKIVGSKIDICFKNMNEAMKFGKKKVKVVLITKPEK